MNKKRTIFLYISLCILLMIFIISNLCYGSVKVSGQELVDIISRKTVETVNSKIIMEIRWPRIMAATILGGALALAGLLLQTFFNNPIAGPFVLGVSQGAKLCVAILMLMVLKMGFANKGYMMVIAAFIGALASTGIVLLVSSRVKNMATLIVCGVMIGYICSAITELIITFADDSNIVNLHNWTMGSFVAIDRSDAVYYIPIIAICFIASMFLAKNMEAYAFGESYAKSLGINVKLFRVLLILISSILSATVTAYAGPISFVGIAVPHLIRSLFKSGKPIILIPATFIGGAVFCLFSDLLARGLFAPVELSISTITAIFGAPVVISLLLSRRSK